MKKITRLLSRALPVLLLSSGLWASAHAPVEELGAPKIAAFFTQDRDLEQDFTRAQYEGILNKTMVISAPALVPLPAEEVPPPPPGYVRRTETLFFKFGEGMALYELSGKVTPFVDESITAKLGFFHPKKDAPYFQSDEAWLFIRGKHCGADMSIQYALTPVIPANKPVAGASAASSSHP